MGGFSMSILLLAMVGMFWAFVIAIVILAIIKLALYVFESFGLMKLNKNLGYKHSWTAWIPIYNKYLLGKIAVKPWAGVTLSLLWLIKTVLFILGYIFAGINSLLILTIILVIVTFIVEMIIVSKLYTKYSKYNEVLTVFTAVTLGLLEPIFIFAIRNNKNRS